MIKFTNGQANFMTKLLNQLTELAKESGIWFYEKEISGYRITIQKLNEPIVEPNDVDKIGKGE